MVDQELIRMFFQNRCNAQEAEAVRNYFTQHPEELEAWLPEEEWNKLEAEGTWDENLSERMLRNIRQKAYKKPGGRQLSFLVLTSVAASLLLCLLAFGLFYMNRLPGRPATLAGKEITSSASAAGITRKNTTGTWQQIKLEDGSVVKLQPGSSIRYPGIFKPNRHIYLSGEAFFAVAKDTLHPFTVIAGGLSTTALGTSFTIQATRQEKEVKVQLHTGRVLVKPVSENLKEALTAMYLDAGQELTLDVARRKIQVTAPAMADSRTTTGSVLLRGGILEFNQMPLPQVFTELTNMYHVPITYEEADVAAIQFTGSIHKNRPLEKALQTIAAVNNLKVIKRKGGYIIQKP
jgi:transmembrane sensor